MFFLSQHNVREPANDPITVKKRKCGILRCVFKGKCVNLQAETIICLNNNI